MSEFNVRKAVRSDIPVLHELIKGLAEYEKRPRDVTGCIEDLEYWICDRNIAEALIASLDGEDIGYAIYYPIFASYAAKGKAHLEDLFIKRDYRFSGLGTRLLSYVCQDVLSSGYHGMEWNALAWNIEAIDYYRHIGAVVENGRIYFDLDEENTKKLASRY